MTDLADFLRTRYADAVREQQDESTAWHAPNCESVPGRWRSEIGPCDCGVPARVISEVEAKRRLVDLHSIVHREIGWLEDGDERCGEIPVCGLCVPKHSHYQRREDVQEGPCLTVRLLVLPFAYHPDYRQEWSV